MSIIHGEGDASLYESLNEIDSLMGMDSLIPQNKELSIKITKKPNGLFWSCQDIPLRRYKTKTGKTLQSFLNSLDGLNTDACHYGTNLQVIAYAKAQLKRDPEGNILSTWFLIEPLDPYREDNGMFYLPTVNITVPEKVFSLLMETKIAFINQFDEKLYPIKKEALPSIGRFIDNVAAFNKDNFTIGSAFVLADRIADKKSFRFLTEKIPGEDNIFPILSVVGKNFAKDHQAYILDQVMNQLNRYFLSVIKEWEITGDYSLIQIKLSPVFDISARLPFWGELKIGRTSGQSLSFTLFTQIEDTNIILLQNKLKHKKDMDYTLLTKNMKESCQDFMSKMQRLQEISVKDHLCSTRILKKALGIKRFEAVISKMELPMAGDKYLGIFLQETKHVKLHAKEDFLLKNGFYKWLSIITS